MSQVFKGLPTKQKWAYLRTKMMMGAVGLSVTIDYYGLIWSYSISFGLIRSIQSYSVHSIHICSIQSYSVHFGLIRATRAYSVRLSTLVLFSPFCPLWCHSVQFGHSNLFGPIQFFQSISFYSVSFGPIQFIWSKLVHLYPLRSILVLFGPFLCTYITGKR